MNMGRVIIGRNRYMLGLQRLEKLWPLQESVYPSSWHRFVSLNRSCFINKHPLLIQSNICILLQSFCPKLLCLIHQFLLILCVHNSILEIRNLWKPNMASESGCKITSFDSSFRSRRSKYLEGKRHKGLLAQEQCKKKSMETVHLQWLTKEEKETVTPAIEPALNIK